MAQTFPNATPSQFVEGLQLPAMYNAEVVLSAMKYQPRDGDLFIATYPKCGTTWAQYIISLIFRQGEPFSLMEFFTIAPYLEIGGAKAIEELSRPIAIKVHLPFRLTPRSEKAKYIYISRNPKDCCVSYFHHMKDNPIHGYKGDFDEFFEMFLSGNIDYGDFFDHLLGWYQHRNDPNVLFLTYEEMKGDPKATILKMASFIDDKLYAEPLRNDPEKLNNVVKHSSFDYMKESINSSINDLFSMSVEDIMKADLPDVLKKTFMGVVALAQGKVQEKPNPLNFIRKGIIGDWKNYFSEDQQKRLDEKFSERTKGTDIPNLWKKYV